MQKILRQRSIKALLLILTVFAIGTVGFYILLDHLTLIDCLYLTVVTLATVGYGDLSPHINMPPDGNPYIIKTFAILIILVGMGSVLYGLGVLTEYIVSGDLGRRRNEKRMGKLISSLKDHYIVCGGGRSGYYIMQELNKTLRPFMLIEKSEERIMELQQEFNDLLFIKGDATQDDIVHQAGIENASGVIAVLPDEKDNLFIVMSMAQNKSESGRRPKIAAKVENFRKMAPKMENAGADCIISPKLISSRRMVSEMFRPSVTTFLDRMLNDDRAVIRVEEVTVSDKSDLAGKTIKEAHVAERTGLLVVAIRKDAAGKFISNPGPEQTIEPNDVLISMGEMDKIVTLRRLAEGK
jgi:voltage-gated potassium channel